MRTSPLSHKAASPSGGHPALFVFIFMLVAGALFVTTTKAQETPVAPVAGAHAEDGLPRGHSVVRGRAVYDDTGRPVRRARVLLLNTDLAGAAGPASMRGGLTDGRGEFRITDVPAGSYLIAVDAPGFISPIGMANIEEEQRLGPLSSMAALDEARQHFEQVSVDGRNELEVTVRARRGGAITGRVSYEDGDPVIGAMVSIMRRRDGRVTQVLTGFNPTAFFGLRTDDRGVYRISGLPPGEYFLNVIESIAHTSARGERDQLSSLFDSAFTGGSPFATTFYQAATSLSGATALRVEAGQELREINITIAERNARTVSGTVVARRGGQPLANAVVTLRAKEERTASLPLFLRRGDVPLLSTQTDEVGQWTFREIPDGAYILTVEPSGEPDAETLTMVSAIPANGNVAVAGSRIIREGIPRSPRRRYARRQQEATVNGGDLTGVVIQLAEGGSISGTIRTEDGSLLVRRPQPQPSSPYNSAQHVPIYALRLEANRTMMEGSDYASLEGGSFTLTGLSAGRFTLSVGGAPGQYYVRSMTWNGRDLLREPLELAESAAITGVQIVLAQDVATLTGRTLSAHERTPVAGAPLLLVPADQSRWRFRNSFLSTASAAGGRFAVQGPPGEYLVIVLAPGSRTFDFTEAAIRERAPTAQRVTLRAGAEQTLDVIVPAGSR